MSKILFSILVEVFRAFVLIFFISACLLSSAAAGTIDLEAAKKLFENGNYEASLYELQKGDYRKSGEALELLARLYSTDEIGIDPKKIEEYLLLASEKDYVPAILGLGFLYEDGDILSAKPAEANKLYLKAFELGNTEAAYYLALNHQYGIGTDVNIEKAIQFYEIAIERGNEDAIIDLGILHVEAEYGAINYPKAYELFSSLAERGIPDAEYNLALMYDQGLGVARDFDKAFSLYLSAHKKGFESATYNLALLFSDELELNGEDYTQLVTAFQTAAKENHPMAIYTLGDMHQYGDGVAKNLSKAASFYSRAADFNDPFILKLIAERYLDIGSELFDLELAKFYYKQAFQFGDSEAACKLGDLYNFFKNDPPSNEMFGLSADNISVNLPTARMWYTEATNAKDFSCSFTLIRSYLDTGQFSGIAEHIGSILQQANEDAENNAQIILQLHSLLAEAYTLQGYRYEAYQVMEKALNFLASIQSNDFLEQMVFRDYAASLVDIDECKIALEYIDVSNEIAREMGNLDGVAMGHNIAAICHERLGNLETAKTNYLAAMEILDNLESFDVDKSIILANLSQLYTEEGNFEEALNYATAALEFQRQWALDGPYSIRTLSEIALIYAKQGASLEAAKTYELLTELFLDRYLSGLHTELDAKHLAEYRDNYRIILEAAAFYQEHEGLNSNKAFELLQTVYISTAQIEATKRIDRSLIDDPEIQQVLKAYQVTLDKIPQLQLEILNEEMQDEDQTNQNTKSHQDQLERLIEEKNKLKAKLSSRLPSTPSSILGKTLSITEVQNKLKPNELVVFPAVNYSDGPLTIYKITKDQLWVDRTKETAEEIRKKVKTLRNSLSFTNAEQLAELPAFDVELSRNIYKALFMDDSAVPESIDNIFVVPTWPITDLPLSVLISEEIDNKSADYADYRFLGLEKNLSYLTAMNAIERKETNREKYKTSTFLGVGDPLLGKKSNNFRGLNFIELDETNLESTFQIENLPSLPATRDELQAIANLFPKGKAGLLLGPDAREEKLKQINLSDYNIISFATHGMMAKEWDMLLEPALILSKDHKSANDPTNGVLTASEIRTLNLKSDLVILSACNTAASDKDSDEGLSGLASAFIFAGSKSVMASHWSVESTSTKELMLKFFEELDNGSSRNNAEALRIAMQSIFNEGYTHPIFWAPFILVE